MPIPLSLRPTRTAEQDKESLFNVLQKIYAERGHLREITEESLKAEIVSDTLEDAPSESSSDVEDTKEARRQDGGSRVKELQAARTEMLQLIGQANNEALTALDFVSLLLSKDRPQSAVTSISPALKSMAPSGTLGLDKTESSGITKIDQQQAKKVTLGFNYDSLNSSAQELLASAKRLEDQIHRETKYWEQILSLSEKGWNLSRIPSQPHTVGVRFGLPEASTRFRARGLAALRPDHAGDISLEPGISSEPKAIRVQIVQARATVYKSDITSLQHRHGGSLHSAVIQARDSVFDEELFSELLLNARDLFAYGVRVIDDQIVVPLQKDTNTKQIMVIDLVSGKGDAAISGPQSLADSFVLALRLSLSNLYRQRQTRRSLQPPPLTLETGQVQGQHSNLLLPLLCHIHHYNQVTKLQDALQDWVQALQSAKLNCSIQTNQDFITKFTAGREDEQANASANRVTAISHVFADSLSTSLNIQLPNSSIVSLKVISDLAAPTYGTEFHMQQDMNIFTLASPRLFFSDYEEVMQYLNVVLRQSTLDYLSKNLSNCTLDADMTGLNLAKQGNKEKLTVALSHNQVSLNIYGSGFNARNDTLGIWQGELRGDGLLEVARRVLSNRI